MSTPATTPLTYNGYVTQIANLAVYTTTTQSGVITPSDSGFATLIPQMLNYSELRIQRDLDLIGAQNTISYTATTSNLSIPIDDFVTVETITSVPTATPTAQPALLLPTTREFIMAVYGINGTFVGPPQYFAPSIGPGVTYTAGSSAMTYLLGPTPDQSYTISATGMSRLTTLNTYNTTATAGVNTTLISTYFPDLLLMASMVFISGYQRNFGRQSDDPSMSVSYESQYKTLLTSALTEENRKKFLASAYTAQSTSPVATPGR
jgi:hypothetical protein